VPYNGNGSFSVVWDWTDRRDAGANISASEMDQQDSDIATGLSTAICKDGQTTITANLPMANFRHTGVANASARTDYAAYGQVIDNSGRYSSVSGTNTIVLSLTPALTVYPTGGVFYFKAAGTNTGNVTININGLGAKSIKKQTLGGVVELKPGDIQGGTMHAIAYDGVQFQLLSAAGEGYRGDCRLTYTNATTLTLVRKNGDRLCIEGVNEQIPAAGVTLSNGGLSANTTYNIYAYMNSGTMTLEASTTAHTEDSTTGMEIKSGAATRTLVGMARTNGSSQFAQTSANLGVLTYFNRRVKRIQAAFTADRTTTSTSYTELNSEIRLPFLTWGDNDVAYAVRGVSSNDTNNTRHFTAVGIETGGSVTVRGGAVCRQGASTNSQEMNSAFSGFSDESEGYHYATVMGKVGAGTGTWSGGAATAELDITLSIMVIG
jgi:hypothetical protein